MSESINAVTKINDAIKAFDELYETLRENKDQYHAQVRFLNTGISMGLDADLARVSRIIIGIRRDLENARGET